MKEPENDIIEMTDEEGNSYKAEVIEIVNFEGREYAVLSPIEHSEDCICNDDDCGCGEYVLMKVINENDEYSFETIDDEDEFERVSAYIEESAEEIEE